MIADDFEARAQSERREQPLLQHLVVELAGDPLDQVAGQREPGVAVGEPVARRVDLRDRLQLAVVNQYVDAVC